MPAAFDNCVKKGGYIKTVSMTGKRYYRTCALHGKTHKGEIKKKKKV